MGGALQGAGIHAGVEFSPVAFALAEMRTYTSRHAGKGILCPQVAQSFPEQAFFNKRLHFLDRIPGGAGVLAGRRAELFLEAVAEGDGPGDFSAVFRRHDDTPFQISGLPAPLGRGMTPLRPGIRPACDSKAEPLRGPGGGCSPAGYGPRSGQTTRAAGPCPTGTRFPFRPSAGAGVWPCRG